MHRILREGGGEKKYRGIVCASRPECRNTGGKVGRNKIVNTVASDNIAEHARHPNICLHEVRYGEDECISR